MKALILGESSRTTREEEQSAIDYYQGNFLPIAGLSEDISKYATTNTYIITDDFGLVKGSDDIQNMKSQSKKQAITEATDLLLNHVHETDIVIILLTTSVFEETIADCWDELVDAANKDSIWCLGTGRGTLSNLDLDLFRNQIDELLIYERVGVAPIDKETRKALLNKISAQSQHLQ